MKKKYSVDELFPNHQDVFLTNKTVSPPYSTFVDVRDLEWAKGEGLRVERKKRLR